MNTENKPGLTGFARDTDMRSGAIIGLGFGLLPGRIDINNNMGFYPSSSSSHADHLVIEKHPSLDVDTGIVEISASRSEIEEDILEENILKLGITLFMAGFWLRVRASSKREMEGAFEELKQQAEIGTALMGMGLILTDAALWSMDLLK